MKIGINLTYYIEGVVGGLGVYIQSLLHYLPLIAPQDEFFVFCRPESYESLLKYKVHLIVSPDDNTKISGFLLKAIIKNNIDVWYCPLLFLDPLEVPIPSVITVPDFQHKYFPDFLSKKLLKERERLFPISIKKCNGLTTISNASKKDVLNFFPINEKKVEVIYLDAPPWFKEKISISKHKEILKKYRLQRNEYLFYPANFWPHKNHKRLLQAFKLLTKKYKDFSLVFSGFAYKDKNNLSRLIKSMNLAKKVKYLGFIPKEEMPIIYRNSLGLVFPSIFEGFGIPLIEAMKTGCPIVCSSINSIREVAGESALYFDPFSVSDIKNKLELFIKNKKLRSSLVKKGLVRSKKYSYLSSIKKTLKFIKKVARRELDYSKKMSEWPKISVITPSYNQGKYLKNTIDSVLSQNYPNLEYIVVDGDSTDNTLDILKKYGRKIKWLSEKDKGQTDAINKGLRMSKGNIISYLNSDDTYEPGVLHKVAKIFTNNPGYKIIYGKGRHIDESGKVIEDYHNALTNNEFLKATCDICQPATFWRKDLLKKIGFFDPEFDYAMDYEYWIRVSKKYVFNFINEYFANSRLHKDTKTLSKKRSVIKNCILIQKKHYGSAHEDWISELSADEVVNRSRKKFTDRAYIYSYLIFKSLFYSFYFNWAFPSKLLLKKCLHWFKLLIEDFVFTYSLRFPSPISRFLIKLRTFFYSHQEFAIINQHPPKKLYVEKFPKTKNKKFYTFSIVTPSFNQGRFIEKTIKSVINQDYPKLEYVVQDGKSTDNTLKVLRKYKDKIKYYSKKDHGQAEAINLGFKKTTGEIMAYLNSDDMYAQGNLFFINDFFQKHPEIDIVYGFRLIIDSNDNQIGRWVLYRHDPRVLKFTDYVPQETMFWRRRIWDKVGGIDESFKFAMDWDLIIRFLKSGAKFARLPYFLGMFRYHEKQKTTAQTFSIGLQECDRILTQLHKTQVPRRDVGMLDIKYRNKSSIISTLFDLGVRI